MVSRRLQKRLEGEAAEKQGKKPAETTAKKRKAGPATPKVKKPSTRKRKAKATERKRLLWGVFSGTLKEEGRFPYDQLDKAEERLEQLRSKSKKLYFIQPIKEVISDSPPLAPVEAAPIEDEEPVVEPVITDSDDDAEDEAADEEE